MIEINHVTKKYGDHVAISDLSLTIQKGQIYGFLGPNGAGKSTLMNMITGCIAVTSGEIKIDGHDIYEDAVEVKKHIGYLPEIPPLYVNLTPQEYLRFVAQAKKIAKKQIEEQIDYVIEVTQISNVKDRLIRNLSKGYRQRVGVAQALLGNPEIIILDEPTVGLDPHQIIEMRNLITELGKNHTVIFSSHILSEVQAVCQTIMIISKGKIVACDTPENLEKQFTGTTTVDFAIEGSREDAFAILGDVHGILSSEILGTEDGCCSMKIITNRGRDLCRDLFFAAKERNCVIIQMNMMKATLENIFIELTTMNEESGKQTANGKEL